jgi:hypothetical protein
VTKRTCTSTAYHEAGHAVIAYHVAVKVQTVTIVPGSEYLGLCHHAKVIRGKYPEADYSDRTRLRMEKLGMIALGGPIAQRLYNPRSVRRYHASSDYRAVADVALQVSGGSTGQAEAWMRWLEIRTSDALRLRWIVVEALAEELMERRTLAGRTLCDLIAKS